MSSNSLTIAVLLAVYTFPATQALGLMQVLPGHPLADPKIVLVIV